MKILIADDHTVFREGLNRIFAEAADISEIGEASNAQQLLERVAEKRWDVVLLDISMPGKSGLEVLKEIKQINPRLAVLDAPLRRCAGRPEHAFRKTVRRARD
jgi:two-component system, NarL family, invasion response regulator UvrY